MLETGLNRYTMELLELIKSRRSIRKYSDQQIAIDAFNQIIEAGIFAPNAGGGQRSMVVGIHNPELAEKIGKLNLGCMDRSRLAGGYVSKEQPSIIDDPNIKSGFYGAPSVAIIFAQKNFLYSIPDAFCCAENMVLMAKSLGISSCIIARGEETFANPEGAKLLQEWDVPENMIARCFVILGYNSGDYPAEKPRKAGRIKIIQ
jgi:nitroreductase